MRIAVVICTKDRLSALRKTLVSVWRQSRKPDELLIIDDGRLDDATRAELSRDAAANGVRIVYHQKDQPGLTRSRNVAAQLSTSDILVYLDDDVTCEPNLLEEVDAIMADARVSGLSPIVREPALEGRSAHIWQLGYRIAGWWSVRPRVITLEADGLQSVGSRRVTTRGPAPAVLAWEPHRAQPLRWLSGAAMALRRDVVLAHPFDENLTQYALGEDREMGYRLAPRFWLLEALQTHVEHRRETGGRGDPHRFGFMTSRNYLYILTKTCRISLGEWALVAWSLLVVGLMHAVWGLARRPDHWRELQGMAEGVWSFARERLASNVTMKQVAAATSAVTDSIRTLARPTEERSTDALLTPCATPKSQMRVMFVTNRLEPGGAELMLIALAKQLPALGIEPVIVCLKDAGPLASELRVRGIVVHENLLHFKTDLAVIARLRRLLRDESIDLLTVAHSGGDRMFWSTLSAASCETPVIVWSHWFPRDGHQHFETANRALYRMVDSFVALGERQRRAMIRHEQVPAGRISVIHNAIELDSFIGRSRGAARKLLRLTDDQFAVGIVANMRVEKRHDAFIGAARLLGARHPNMRFFIIGDGPNRDAVQAAAAASRLDHERLRLLGARHDVADLLPGLDAACLCSDIECFSVSMLEAAVCGVPFIAPDVGCLGEFLIHEETGLLTRPADPQGLAMAIERLTVDASLCDTIIKQARQRVIHQFGVESMAKAFSDLFRDVAWRGNKSQPVTTRQSQPSKTAQPVA